MPNYGDIKYWEERYKNSEYATFDWLENYPTLKEIITSLNIPKESGKILNLGCGNSEFSENMYDDGYHNIKNIDISHYVIDLMKERSKNRPEMTYEVMDVRDIKYESNYFDLAIDKSTIDALLCGDDAFINVAKMIKEVQRVLKVGGYYMIISYGTPDNRVLHLNRKFEKFKIEILKIEKDFVEEEGYDNYHYIYLCQKLEGADEVSKQYFEETLEELIQQQKIENEAEEQEEVENTEIIVKNEVNLTDKIDNINNNNIIIQNENDGKQCNLSTALKIELNNNNKKENQINGEKNKLISDIM
jgi:ubiquinone/menaquinone biosynthesis C-methylase UbiE